MAALLSYLLFAALLALVIVLAFGLITMARGGSGSSQRSNRLMRWRIALQLGALVLIALYLVFSTG